MSWAKLRMVRGMAERRALRRLERRAAKRAAAPAVIPLPPSLSMELIREAVAAGDMVAKAAKASAVQPPQGRTAARSDAAESRVSEDIARPDGRAQDRSSKIDISAAPSGMEAAAARWEGKGTAPVAIGPVTVLCEGKVMCRCGAQGPGQTRGPVPAWFGDKCIETNRELRARRGLMEIEGASRG